MAGSGAAERAAAAQDAATRDRASPRELDYHQLWQTAVIPILDDLLVAALLGGRIADRLAWVFVAGYQSACRATFPEAAGSGWVTFAVSEDRAPVDPLPPVAFHETDHGQVLQGSKTWIAAVNSVEQLVVKSDRGARARYWLVERAAPGLTLESRDAPEFLRDLSQGRAHFVDVPITALQPLDATRVDAFRWFEALYIYAAFCGFVQAHATTDDLLRLCGDCLDGIQPALTALLANELDVPSLQKADARAQDLLVSLSGNRLAAAGDWDTDQRLIAMYSKAIRQLQPG